MRTRAVVVATLVLLAGASSALAATPNAHDAAAEGTAPTANGVAVQDQADNESYQYQNLTIGNLTMTNVSVQQAVLNETELDRGSNGSQLLGTATASNLTVVNASFENVTLRNVTIRNATVAEQLFGGETPAESENATIENATLSETGIQTLFVETGRLASAEVNNVRTSFSPGGVVDGSPIEGEPTVEIENMTVGSAVLDTIEANRVSIENASAGIGIIGGGTGGETTTEDAATGDDTGNETGALAVPER
ncbi:hypothetical protein [Halorussus pelagicus]|uniref:hypothetical protein n=1 Tax=Halorussus pelagicus TaxID=2505977 RepID=UPI000FFBB76D|nr:hypothetical protein [Halorussus pelagicus]